MPSIHRHAIVPYSAEQMFELVNDVKRYQEFLPGCQKSSVIEESSSHMKAVMVLAKVGIKQELTTLNELVQGESIKMRLAEGPFKSLNGEWRFSTLTDEACKIELSLEFVFANKVAEMAIGKVFKSLANNMVTAFSERAKQIYG